MKEIIADKKLVAPCGLYCGCCFAYIKEKCPGCPGNEKASWCKIRDCCGKNNYETCAECKTFKQAEQCPKFNNLFSKILGFCLNSDRNACIEKIKIMGREQYAQDMAKKKRRTIKKR